EQIPPQAKRGGVDDLREDLIVHPTGDPEPECRTDKDQRQEIECKPQRLEVKLAVEGVDRNFGGVQDEEVDRAGADVDLPLHALRKQMQRDDLSGGMRERAADSGEG